MVDIVHTLLNPFFLVGAAVPTVIGVAAFLDAKRREPEERRKIEAQTEAAEAQTDAARAQVTESLLTSINQVNRLLKDVREHVSEQVLFELNALRQVITEKLEALETHDKQQDQRLDVLEEQLRERVE